MNPKSYCDAIRILSVRRVLCGGVSSMSQPFRTLAVVGAGNMGSGIAQKMATEGFDVILVDVDDEKVARGLRDHRADAHRRRSIAASCAPTGRRRSARASTARRASTTSRDADLVVEAVFEDLRAQAGRLRAARARVPARRDPRDQHLVVSRSPTSRRRVKTPERVLGLHYFYHPAKNRLVEVVPGADTDPRRFARAWALQEQLGKTPIASRGRSGFIVNRFFVVVADGSRSACSTRAIAEHRHDRDGREAGVRRRHGTVRADERQRRADRRCTRRRRSAPRSGRCTVRPSGCGGRSSRGSRGRSTATGSTPASSGGRRSGWSPVIFLVAAALVDEGVGTIEDTDIGARVGLRWARARSR